MNSSTLLRLMLTFLSVSFAGNVLAALPRLGPVYTDFMVLQRDQPILIQGFAGPGEEIVGNIGNERVDARAGLDGHFELIFKRRPASNSPITIRVMASGGEVALNDVLVGDVFLCSGQSNMKMPVRQGLSGDTAWPPDSSLRLLTIPMSTSLLPSDTLKYSAAWVEARQDTIADFSGACYFMAKKLREDRPDVPIGLINSSWGDSSARPWLRPESIRKLFGKHQLDLLELARTDQLAAVAEFSTEYYRWWSEGDNGRQPWLNSGTLDWKPIPRFSVWNEWHETELATDPSNNVWLRNTFILTDHEAMQSGKLAIGAIEDLEFTWVNGRPVGYTFGWEVERKYDIPAHYLRSGENEVLILASNFGKNMGGFNSTPDRLKFESASKTDPIPMGHGWEYSIAGKRPPPPRAPWDTHRGVGGMYNAMIRPLGNIRLAGVVWYQGESDRERKDYPKLLRELIAGWRDQFGREAKILIVQLANFGSRYERPGHSDWARLRNDQFEVARNTDKALSEGSSGGTLVSIILGDEQRQIR